MYYGQDFFGPKFCRYQKLSIYLQRELNFEILFINLYKYESIYLFCSYAAQFDAVNG